jgi:paraquat-inducible protein A
VSAGSPRAADAALPAGPEPVASPARTSEGTPLVCHDCAQVHAWQALTGGRIARCVRCDAVLARGHRLEPASLLALTLAAAVVFVIMLAADLVTIRLRGAAVSTTIPAAIGITWEAGAPLVAVLVMLTAVVAPAAYIGLRLYVLLPLVAGRLPLGLGVCMRALHVIARWNTVAVLAVAGLMSLVRMAALAQASVGPGLVALGALALLLAAIESAGLRHLWPPDVDWDASDGRVTTPLSRRGWPQAYREAGPGQAATPAATPNGLPPGRWHGCECCGWVGRLGRPAEAALGADGEAVQEKLYCERCGHRLQRTRALGLQRTWALLAASAVLLVPANVLPMMSTIQALRASPHTLLGGIAELWQSGSWGLAAIVFIASIVVPILKVAALALLAWSVERAPHWHPVERVRLYRLVEAVGHWSMLDVYVVLLLVGMVRFGNLAGALPGPALLAFAGVVVLTMLATHNFDPRWIWQTPRRPRERWRRPAHPLLAAPAEPISR